MSYFRQVTNELEAFRRACEEAVMADGEVYATAFVVEAIRRLEADPKLREEFLRAALLRWFAMTSGEWERVFPPEDMDEMPWPLKPSAKK